MMKSSGRYYVLTVLVGCLFMASAIGTCGNSDAVFLTPMAEGLQVGRGAITLYITIAALVTCLLYPVAFQMQRKFSIKAVSIAGILIAAASCAGMGLAKSVFGIYVCAFFRGIGVTCYSNNMVALLLNRWFRDQNSTMTAIAFATAGVAGALLNPFFTALILTFGYQAALFVRAGVILLLALPGAVLILREDPADVGLAPYTAARTGRLSGRARESAHAAPLRTRSWLFFFLAAYMVFICAASRLVDQIPGYAESIGQGPRIGALLASAYMVGSVVFKLVVGVLNDSIGVVKTTAGGCVLALVGVMLLLCFPGSLILLLAGAFLYSVTLALASVTLITLAGHVYGEKESGTAMEFLTPFTALYPPLLTVFGILYDVTGAYTAVLLLCAGLCVLCLLLLLAIESRARRGVQPRCRPGPHLLKRP